MDFSPCPGREAGEQTVGTQNGYWLSREKTGNNSAQKKQEGEGEVRESFTVDMGLEKELMCK